VLDRRTALSNRERAHKAGEANAAAAARDENGKFSSNLVTDGAITKDGQKPAKTPKKPRIRTEVAKQAAISERRVQACAAIRRPYKGAAQRRLEACRSLGWTEVPMTVVDLEQIVRRELRRERRAVAVPSE
jgi:hypothetical protein